MSIRERVLILDYDELVLIELERILEDAGFDTTTTWDIHDALQLLGTVRYDFILMGDCFSGAEAECLLAHISSAENAPSTVPVLLSGSRTYTLRKSSPANLPSVCKHCPDQVLQAMRAGQRHSCAQAA